MNGNQALHFQLYLSASYSTIVLYVGIIKVRDLLPQNITQSQLYIYFLTSKQYWFQWFGIAKLKNVVRLPYKPFHQVNMKFLKFLVGMSLSEPHYKALVTWYIQPFARVYATNAEWLPW